MDYGFHAPTISFPVAGTLMVEPTESESKAELDRFCEAMIAIHGEIAPDALGRVGRSRQPAQERAAHRGGACRRMGHGYSREKPPCSRSPRCAPGSTGRQSKRVDNVYGDRNVVCTCPPMEAYA